MENFLEVIDLKKWFPGVKANDGVNLTLKRGEVHAILGENGAGKSTLMKMIYGLLEPTSGEIRLAGQAVHFRSPREAIHAGIGMVHQHFMLIPALTVAENVVLGDEPGGVNYNRREAVKRVRELSEKYGLDIDPTAKISQLSVGLQQRVEILKAFYRKARLIILDEPTALLTPQETRELFNIVRSLKAEGTPVLFISHKLDEVKEISDRVTVMRAGKTVDTVSTSGATPQDLANMMVGREVVLRVEKKDAELGAPVLQLNDVKVRDKSKNLRVKGITLELRRGEILGLAGIDGNGQFELADAIAGLLKPEGGQIVFDGADITHLSPAQRTERGIAYVPQDRHADGLVLEFDLVENTILRDFRKRPYSKSGVIRRGASEDYTKRLIQEFDVRPPHPSRKASELSGGNQQKVILAREVSRGPMMLIAAQPTRGLDVGAIEGIHRQLIRLRDEGKGVLLVSLEMDEILSLSDRIAVIHDGQIVDVVPGDTATREQIGLLMTGTRANAEVSST
ncbi:ABC transporter ATP-binding protein [Alicyclobacillus fastidiosus]|uniref:ABC transporter ATP-binding protein n=1 Tax=Alicyclobacillus fastidiosus TaxID=392011 RepID=A0ABY6ZHT5_9BACL|nr:ABC transporter ATP-binding protein [Alicyclobacillus fastidiosus]WAH41684.1 ABC transporter ATP-binding protein [Alicyclobacillus fastidiosus]GMA63363.1 ABC transporter ATP-binding protein [Alicyclobacillus fastidiosus]